MRTEYLELGPCPVEEPCVNVGEVGRANEDDAATDVQYDQRAQAECLRWKAQLENHFKPFPPGVWLGIKRFNHDFGPYYEVVAYYREGDEDFAINMQNNLPLKWN